MTGDRRAAGDSLRGLALGDGFGERWFHQGGGQGAIEMIRARRTPTEAQFFYTDDTSMALPIVRVLCTAGRVDAQHLAELFAATFAADPYRGYGYGMTQLLPRLASDPGNWATYARSLFGGEGSLGNGAAMRVAPLGAWFHADLELVVEQAALSAGITHAHPEGIAGAVAVAVAAALSAESRSSVPPTASELLENVAHLTPDGPIRDGVLHAREVGADVPPWKAADVLGNGSASVRPTPFRSRCGARRIISTTSRTRCGPRPKGSATSTRRARSWARWSVHGSASRPRRRPGWSCANRCRTGPKPFRATEVVRCGCPGPSGTGRRRRRCSAGPGGDPVADRPVRAALHRDPLVARSVDQRLHHQPEDHFTQHPALAAAQRRGRVEPAPHRQQHRELVPQGPDQG